MNATPVLFLDNLNSTSLRSDLLASVLTEPRVDVRLLGVSQMVSLNTAALVAVTGNGLRPSEDQARRFIACQLDARMEDPERRPFPPGFLQGVEARRGQLLVDALTIWRWGRKHEPSMTHSRPLGSYENWCQWVRDPLLELGCADPIEQTARIKARDPVEERNAELFITWWTYHQNRPVRIAELDLRVSTIIDPQRRGRQFQAAVISRLVDTRAGGFVLTRQDAAGNWGAGTYALRRTSSDDGDVAGMPG